MRGVPVPDLVGLTFAQAVEIGRRLEVLVVGVAPDGRPVDPDSAGVVVEQEPTSGGIIKRGRRITVRVGRPPGGSSDREPLTPLPLHQRDREDFGPDRPDRLRDNDSDLVPAG